MLFYYFTCAQKPTQVSLIYCTEPKSGKKNNWKVKMDMLRSIDKQFGESIESDLKKKRTALVGSIYTKGRF